MAKLSSSTEAVPKARGSFVQGDWSQSRLGAVQDWPRGSRTARGIVAARARPIALDGPEALMSYCDGARQEKEVTMSTIEAERKWEYQESQQVQKEVTKLTECQLNVGRADGMQHSRAHGTVLQSWRAAP